MKRQKIKNFFKSKRGLTLVEALVATLILSIVIVGVVALFAKTRDFLSQIKENSIANNTLNERLEEIRGMDYTSILALGTTFTAAGFSQLKSATGSVTVDDPFSKSDIRRITLTVSWTSAQGRAKSKSLAMLVTNKGINKK